MTRNSRVFIPQEPTRVRKERDSVSGDMVPVRDGGGNVVFESTMNFAEAARFGETLVCLPPGRVSLSAQPTVDRIKECMGDFTDNDYLIAVGNPSLIAVAAAVAAQANNGRLKVLQYDNRVEAYITITIDINK